MARIMSKNVLETVAVDEAQQPNTVKDRQCLKCKATFQSEWSGERVCRRCKGTNAWRNGLPAGSHSSFN